MGVISTRSPRQPSASTTRFASCSASGALDRYGMDTASTRSGPMARAARKATVAESMPPDSPTTSRSKPVCSSWELMNPTITPIPKAIHQPKNASANVQPRPERSQST